MNCTNCGEKLETEMSSCPKCGNFIGSAIDANPQTVSFYQTMELSNVNRDTSEVEVLDENLQDLELRQQNVNQVPFSFPQVSPIPIQQHPAPQPVIGGIRPSQHPNKYKKKKSVWLIILIFFLIVGGCVGGYFIYDIIQDKKVEEKEDNKKEQEKDKFDENKNNNEDKNNDGNKEEETSTNGVVIKDIKKMSNGSLLLLVENKSSKTIGADIEFNFYNQAMKLLGSIRTHVALAPNSERYALVADYVLNEEYASMDTKLSVFDYGNLINIENIDSKNISKTELGNEWLLQYQNFTKNNMIFEAICLFYQNNEIVYAISGSTSNIVEGNKGSVGIDLLSLSGIQYSMYEIYGYAQYDIR